VRLLRRRRGRLVRGMVAAEDEVLAAVAEVQVAVEADAAARVADVEDRAAVEADMDVRVRADLAAEVPVDARAASVSISARRKFAGSAWIKWISLITRRPTCCSSLCRNAESFYRGGLLELVRVINGG
jgi:hypothetical protein